MLEVQLMSNCFRARILSVLLFLLLKTTNSHDSLQRGDSVVSLQSDLTYSEINKIPKTDMKSTVAPKMMVNKHAILQARVNIAPSSPVAYEEYSNLKLSLFGRRWTVILDELPGGNQEDQEFIHLEQDVDLTWENRTLFKSDLSFLVPLRAASARTFIVSLLEMIDLEMPRLVTRRLANFHAINAMVSEGGSYVVSVELNGMLEYKHDPKVHFFTSFVRGLPPVTVTVISATIALFSYLIVNVWRKKQSILSEHEEENETCTTNSSPRQSQTSSDESYEIGNTDDEESLSSWDESNYYGKGSFNDEEEKREKKEEGSIVEPPEILRRVDDLMNFPEVERKGTSQTTSPDAANSTKYGSPPRNDVRLGTIVGLAQTESKQKPISRADITASIDLSAMHSSDEEIPSGREKKLIASRSLISSQSETKLIHEVRSSPNTPVEEIRVKEISSRPIQHEIGILPPILQNVRNDKMDQSHSTASSLRTPSKADILKLKGTTGEKSKTEEACKSPNAEGFNSQAKDVQEYESPKVVACSTGNLPQCNNKTIEKFDKGKIAEIAEGICDESSLLARLEIPTSKEVKIEPRSRSMAKVTSSKLDIDDVEIGEDLDRNMKKPSEKAEKLVDQTANRHEGLVLQEIEFRANKSDLENSMVLVASSTVAAKNNFDSKMSLDVAHDIAESKPEQELPPSCHSENDGPTCTSKANLKCTTDVLCSNGKDSCSASLEKHPSKDRNDIKSKVVTPVTCSNNPKPNSMQISDSDGDISIQKLEIKPIGDRLKRKGQTEVKAQTPASEDPTADIIDNSQPSQIDQNWLQRLKSRPKKVIKPSASEERAGQDSTLAFSSDRSSYASTLDPDSEDSSSELPSLSLDHKTLSDPFEFKLPKTSNVSSMRVNGKGLKRSRDKYELEQNFSCQRNKASRITAMAQKISSKAQSKPVISVCSTDVIMWEPTEKERLSIPKQRKKRRNRTTAILPDTTPSLQLLTKTITAPVWQYGSRHHSSKDSEKELASVSHTYSTNEKDLPIHRRATRSQTRNGQKIPYCK